MRSMPRRTPAIYKGDVWSFTAETYGYPVKPVKATASSSMIASMGPDKTIDGSGLDALDQHSTSAVTDVAQQEEQYPDLDPIRVRQGLQAVPDVGVELQSGG